jgi:hypothetical protein
MAIMRDEKDAFPIIHIDPVIEKKVDSVKTAISTGNLKEIGIQAKNIENTSERKLG